jgi:predicted enzyme related to lactoylglutathione lyase
MADGKNQSTNAMSENKNCPAVGEFSWNELVSSNAESSRKFYTGLFGWKAEAFPGDTEYTLFKQGDTMVGGLMQCPKAGQPSHWLPYVTVEDVDATAAKAKALGAQVVLEPFDVKTVGRIAVLLDPLGAAIGLFKPAM